MNLFKKILGFESSIFSILNGAYKGKLIDEKDSDLSIRVNAVIDADEIKAKFIKIYGKIKAKKNLCSK